MFKELEELYKGLVNFRNYEVLCESPRISYIECDYTGEYDEGIKKLYGYVCNTNNEELNIFNANVSDKVKHIFKESCIKLKKNSKKIKFEEVA